MKAYDSITITDVTDGVSIEEVAVCYGVSQSPENVPEVWEDEIPQVDDGWCLWTKTITYYTDNRIEPTVVYSYVIQSSDRVMSSVTEYCFSEQNENEPENGWESDFDAILTSYWDSTSDNKYIWQRTMLTYNSGNTIYIDQKVSLASLVVGMWCEENGKIKIDGGNIAAGSITANQIHSNTITSEKIAAGEIKTDNIQAGAITADKIKAEAITADKIAAGAITADKIAVDGLSAISANLGSIQSVNIQSEDYGKILQWAGGYIDATFDITSNNQTVTLRNFPESAVIDWGDGSEVQCGAEEIKHSYSDVGIYTCKISCITLVARTAFAWNSRLTHVTIGGGVSNIVDSAFAHCTNLKSVIVSYGVESIAGSAFQNCQSLTSVILPLSLKNIAGNAFLQCKSLKRIEVPSSVTTINQGAFAGCIGLEEMTLPFVGKARRQYTDTYQYPFGYIFGTGNYTGCEKTTQYYYGSVKSSTTSTDYYIPVSLKKVTITGGTILYGAFYNCKNLTSVTMPDGADMIDWRSFNGCSNLTSVVIPDSIAKIGSYAFAGCRSLTSIYYKSTEDDWSKINIQANNDYISQATKYYYSESQPTEEGNYWRYDGFKISCNDEYLIDSNYFKVSHDGKVKATDVDLSGKITADSGQIGNCSILHDGSIVSDSGRFSIDSNGDLQSTSGDMGGFRIQDGMIVSDNGKLALIGTGKINATSFNTSESTCGSLFSDKIYGATNNNICLDFVSDESVSSVQTVNFTATLTVTNAGVIAPPLIINRGKVDVKVMAVDASTGKQVKLQKDTVVTVTLTYSVVVNGPKSVTKKCSVEINSGDSEGYSTVDYSIKVDGEIYCLANTYQCSPSSIDQSTGSDSNYGVVCTGNILPKTDAKTTSSYHLGDITHYWAGLYTDYAHINTMCAASCGTTHSDQNKKNTINILSPSYGQIFDKLRPVTFKYNDGTSDRTHAGFIAQEVRDAALEAGLTTQDFAAYCEWTEDDGTQTCGLRYEELIALCVDQIQKLKTRVDELENALATRQNIEAKDGAE